MQTKGFLFLLLKGTSYIRNKNKLVVINHNKKRRYEMYKTQAKKFLAFALAVVMTIPMLVGPTTVNVYASQPPPTQTTAATNNPFVTGGRIRDQEATDLNGNRAEGPEESQSDEDIVYQAVREFLDNTQITDLTALAVLTNLSHLRLSNSPTTDWTPVAHLEEVRGRP
jgi:hypothetical protein